MTDHQLLISLHIWKNVLQYKTQENFLGRNIFESRPIFGKIHIVSFLFSMWFYKILISILWRTDNDYAAARERRAI